MDWQIGSTHTMCRKPITDFGMVEECEPDSCRLIPKVLEELGVKILLDRKLELRGACA